MNCSALQSTDLYRLLALHCTELIFTRLLSGPQCKGRRRDPALVVPAAGGDIPSGAQNTDQ